jgi:adenylate kinase family enzyme
MTVKGIIAIVVTVLCIIGIMVLGAYFADDNILGPLTSIVITTLVSAAPLFFEAPRHKLKLFVQTNIIPGRSVIVDPQPVLILNSYRILLFGLPGSGKTTLIKSMLTVQAPKAEISTDEYDVYQAELTTSLRPLIKQWVEIADYKGNKPSQITVNPPERFFGAEENRLINSIFFIVDLFPRIDEKKHTPMDPEETREWVISSYQSKAHSKIMNRLKQCELYMNKWQIEQVFAAAFSTNNLRSVRLIINKSDILNAVIKAGYLPGIDAASFEMETLKYFEEIESNIRKACEENQVSDFSVCILSAGTGENVNTMLGCLLNTEM